MFAYFRELKVEGVLEESHAATDLHELGLYPHELLALRVQRVVLALFATILAVIGVAVEVEVGPGSVELVLSLRVLLFPEKEVDVPSQAVRVLEKMVPRLEPAVPIRWLKVENLSTKFFSNEIGLDGVLVIVGGSLSIKMTLGPLLSPLLGDRRVSNDLPRGSLLDILNLTVEVACNRSGLSTR